MSERLRVVWAWIKHPTRGPWLVGPRRRNSIRPAMWPCSKCGDPVADHYFGWPLDTYCLPHAEMLRAERLPAPSAPRAVVEIAHAGFTDGGVSVAASRIDWTTAPATPRPLPPAKPAPDQRPEAGQ